MIPIFALLLLCSSLSFAPSASNLATNCRIVRIVIPSDCRPDVEAGVEGSAFAISQDVTAPQLEQLSEQKRWTEIIRLAESTQAPSADLQYYYGLAVFHVEAQLGNFERAQQVLLAGHNSYPRDKRFPTELAGIAFRQKNYSQAARWLQRALQINPRDAYANDFLATAYFLEGNLDAALKYWNRVDKPHVAGIRFEPQPTLDPILLDRAFAFAPESTLRLEELWTTESRLRALGIFPSSTIDLAPRADGQFDTLFRSVERNGLDALFYEQNWQQP